MRWTARRWQPAPYTMEASHAWSIQLIQPRPTISTRSSCRSRPSAHLPLRPSCRRPARPSRAQPRARRDRQRAPVGVGRVFTACARSVAGTAGSGRASPSPRHLHGARFHVRSNRRLLLSTQAAVRDADLRADRHRHATGRPLTPDQLKAALDAAPPIGYEEGAPAGPAKRLLHRERTLYWSDGVTTLLPLGAMGRHGLRGESYRLAFTKPLLDDLLGDRWSLTMLVEGRFVLSDDYKAAGLFPRTTRRATRGRDRATPSCSLQPGRTFIRRCVSTIRRQRQYGDG